MSIPVVNPSQIRIILPPPTHRGELTHLARTAGVPYRTVWAAAAGGILLPRSEAERLALAAGIALPQLDGGAA